MELADRLADIPGLAEKGPTVIRAVFDRPTKGVTFLDLDAVADLAGKTVLVLDSAIHSGSTMHCVVREAYEQGASAVVSYSLVLKRRATFVPTYWGLTIGDFDRAYFLLKKIPNNRLRSDAVGTYLRRLASEDVDTLGAVPCGLDAMDRVSWGDRWWDIQSSERERSTYLLYVGTELCGYVTFVISGDAVTIDEVAVREEFRGRKLGGLLCRWAETMARQARASELNLWGVENQVATYERFGYTKEPSEKPRLLEGKQYFFMRKPIVYNVSPLKLER